MKIDSYCRQIYRHLVYTSKIFSKYSEFNRCYEIFEYNVNKVFWKYWIGRDV